MWRAQHPEQQGKGRAPQHSRGRPGPGRRARPAGSGNWIPEAGEGLTTPTKLSVLKNRIHAKRKPAFSWESGTLGGAKQRCLRDLLPLKIPSPGSLTGSLVDRTPNVLPQASPVRAHGDSKLVLGLLWTLPPVPFPCANSARFLTVRNPSSSSFSYMAESGDLNSDRQRLPKEDIPATAMEPVPPSASSVSGDTWFLGPEGRESSAVTLKPHSHKAHLALRASPSPVRAGPSL